MQLLTFQPDPASSIEDPGTHRLGLLAAGNQIIDLSPVAPSMLQFIALGAPALEHAARLAAAATPAFALSDVRLLAPIPHPLRNIICLGRNYAEHARESAAVWGQAADLPAFPVFFTKATTSINHPDAPIPIDPAVSTQIDWEAELAVIIGRRGKNIQAAAAMSYVFGYTCLNDVTARDLQRQHQQYFKGKSLDGTCPLGPWIVTAAAIPDPHNLRIQCRVNDQLMQDAHTSQMIFNIPHIIAALSQGMTLLPGDIIATGTPSGVGFARTPPQFLHPGDLVEVEIQNIGILRTPIASPH